MSKDIYGLTYFNGLEFGLIDACDVWYNLELFYCKNSVIVYVNGLIHDAWAAKSYDFTFPPSDELAIFYWLGTYFFVDFQSCVDYKLLLQVLHLLRFLILLGVTMHGSLLFSTSAVFATTLIVDRIGLFALSWGRVNIHKFFQLSLLFLPISLLKICVYFRLLFWGEILYFRHLVLRKIYLVNILFVSVIYNLFLGLNICVFAYMMPLVYKYTVVDYGIIELLI